MDLLILFEQWAGHRLLSEKRELKFGMVVNLLVVWYVLFPNYLEVFVGSCHVILVLTCPG